MKHRIILATLLITSLQAQDLKTTVSEVLATNPIILERLKNYNATKEDITSAQSGYYPKLDLNLGVGIENSNATDANGAVSRDNEGYNVYQNSLKYTQNIFDGFATTYLVEEQEYRTVSAAYSYVEKVNNTSFDMVNVYLEVMKNQELLKTAQENVTIDEEIFIKVQKLYESGLTTLSEVNKIESSLALAKSNLVVQENTILDVSYNLQRILGRQLNPYKMSKPVVDVKLPDTREEAAQFAIKNNPSLLVSSYNIKLAQSINKEKHSPFYPKIDIEVSQSMNKNLSAIEGTDDRFRAMAYVSYNIFNGFSDTSALQKSVSSIHKEVQTKNTLRRSVIEGLNLAWSANKKLEEQLQHLIEYKDFSQKTLTLYAKEYDLGRRSLLDLLSAQNDFIRSKAQIITTEYSLLYAKYRILDAMGLLVPTIMQDNNIVYSNVGLKGQTPQNLDSLPIEYDKDKDLIVDDKDLCNNSLSTQMKSSYGCEKIDPQVTQIERYSEFLFSGYDFEDEEKLNSLIKQLTPYGLKNIKFDLLGNAQYEGLSEKRLLELSKKRAKKIETLLIKAGALKGNIQIISNSDEAPMYSSDENKNNRVDIIVKKIKK